MYKITATSKKGTRETVTIIDEETAREIATSYLCASDIGSVEVTDALTGEPIYDLLTDDDDEDYELDDEDYEDYNDDYENEDYDDYEDDEGDEDDKIGCPNNEPQFIGFGCCETIDELCALLDALEERRKRE